MIDSEVRDRRRGTVRGPAAARGDTTAFPGCRRASAVALAAAFLLAACVPPEPQTTIIYPEPLPQQPASPRTYPEPQPVQILPEVELELEDGLPNPANAACMSAVGERAGEYSLRILGNETVSQGTEVTIGVGEDLTRWRCVADPSGSVVDVGEVGASG